MVEQNGPLVVQAGLGFVVLLLVAWLLGDRERNIGWRSVLLPLGTQIVVAMSALYLPFVRGAVAWLSLGVSHLKEATAEGTSFVFGYLGGGALPFPVLEGGNTWILAFQALPMVMVVSGLSMLLFHWRILPLVVRTVGKGLELALGVGAALGVCCAAKVFLGMTEAPLLIRPYLSKLSRSELFSVMVIGMATTAASIMVLYAAVLQQVFVDPMAHILGASLVSVPGAIAISRLMIPQQGGATGGDLVVPYNFNSSMESISVGASDGMKLFWNIVAMLIVMLALVCLGNKILGLLVVADEPMNLQRLFGWLLAPLALCMGIPWQEMLVAGHLLGTKIVLNEVLAFADLAALPPDTLTGTSKVILTYALCGFANMGSVGILVGGLATMVPERRSEIVGLAWRSLFAGAIASCLSGTMVGMLTRMFGSP